MRGDDATLPNQSAALPIGSHWTIARSGAPRCRRSEDGSRGETGREPRLATERQRRGRGNCRRNAATTTRVGSERGAGGGELAAGLEGFFISRARGLKPRAGIAEQFPQNRREFSVNRRNRPSGAVPASVPRGFRGPAVAVAVPDPILERRPNRAASEYRRGSQGDQSARPPDATRSPPRSEPRTRGVSDTSSFMTSDARCSSPFSTASRRRR
jgi:hypothetical protein